MLKYFPVTIAPDGRKIPLIEGWKEKATSDPQQLRLWQELFKSKLNYFGIPTGLDTGILVLDVDVKDNGFDTLKTLNIPATTHQRTMSGGIHFLFKYPKNGKVYGNRVKFLPGLDIRGEGGFIVYYGIDETPISDAPEWLLNAAEKRFEQYQGPVVKLAPELANGIILNSIENIRSALQGERNNTLNAEAFKIGQLVVSESITREYAEQVLLAAATECGIGLNEARSTVKSALDGGAKKPIVSPFGNQPSVSIEIPPPPVASRWTPFEFTMDDLLNTSNLRKPQLFQDWSTEDIHLTSADGGTGKTTLKLYEAICLAIGERFLGFNCNSQGKTLFITGEDTDKKLASMLGAIVRQMGLFEEGVGNQRKLEIIRQSILVKKDADLCLISKDKQGFLHPNQNAFNKVMEAVEDFKPKMIVFDPISSFWGSEAALNDMNKAVTKFMSQLVERSGACVEMINHMGKESSSKMDMTQFAGRGGSGLPSNARVVRALRRVGEEEYFSLTNEQLQDNQSAIYCVISKFSDGSPMLYKPFLIIREGYLFRRKDLTDKKIRETEKQLSDIERVLVYVKKQRLENKYPTKLLIISHFMSCGDTLSEQRVKRAIELLKYEGLMGERLKEIDNPDMTVKDRAFVIIDSDGKEF
jgi:regulatory protein RepA